MKKLLVKIKVIDQPYSPAIPASPDTWVKEVDGEMISLYEQPLKVVDAEMVNDDSYTFIPATAEVPEQPEISHDEIIAQTQGQVEELEVWLEGDKHKYPEGYWIEWIDISAQVIQEKVNADALAYLASTDWMLIREIDAGIPCPAEIKIERQLAREKIIK